MATTVQVKPQALKSIGNVPDWGKQRAKDKKDAAPAPKLARRTAPKPKTAAPQVAPVVAKPPVIPQPITEEVKDPVENGVQGPSAGAKVRRIYSREFLIKFKYTTSPFPPGIMTPQDIIAQYNKDFELRERSAHENSSHTPGKSTVSASVSAPVPSIQQVTESEAPHAAPTTEKRIKKKIEGDKKTFKLRGLENTDESILRSPLFRASASKLQGTKRASSPARINDDKENPVPSKPIKSSLPGAKRRAASPLVTKSDTVKTHKLPTTSSSLISTPAVSAPAVSVTPAPVPVVSIPAPTPAPIAEPMEIKTEATEETTDTVDVLTKKLKSVLKETDPRRLAQRQKQIEYGKATAGYKDYSKQIAKSKRKREDPKTPNKYQVCSKRSWDGQIRKWRRMLHFYDPADLKDGSANPEEGEKPDFAITAEDILAEENALKE